MDNDNTSNNTMSLCAASVQDPQTNFTSALSNMKSIDVRKITCKRKDNLLGLCWLGLMDGLRRSIDGPYLMLS